MSCPPLTTPTTRPAAAALAAGSVRAALASVQPVARPMDLLTPLCTHFVIRTLQEIMLGLTFVDQWATIFPGPCLLFARRSALWPASAKRAYSGKPVRVISSRSARSLSLAYSAYRRTSSTLRCIGYARARDVHMCKSSRLRPGRSLAWFVGQPLHPFPFGISQKNRVRCLTHGICARASANPV